MERWMMKEIDKQGHMWDSIDNFGPEIIRSCKAIRESGCAEKVFLTGCGDCYYISMAVLPLFRRICRGAVYAYPALEFSQYGIDLVDEHSCVVCISMSGKTARSTEAILKAQAKKAQVIGLTNNKNGKLYQCAEHPIFLGLAVEEAWTCGTLITLGSLYALYMIAIELSDLSDGEKKAMEQQLRETAEQIAPVIEMSKPVCEKVGKNMAIMQNDPPVYVLGGGPNYATAKFGAAKYMEIATTLGVGQESEEFCHGELWPIRKTNPVTIIAPTGRSFTRTMEVARALRDFGCDLFMLSNDADACALGKYSIRMPDVDELFSPLLYAAPLELQPYYYSYALGLNPDLRDHIDPFKLHVSHSVIRTSKLDI